MKFEAPGVSTDEHIGDLSGYAQLLAAQPGGKLKEFPIIDDEVKMLRSRSLTAPRLHDHWNKTCVPTPPVG
ncbi:hypothetical protein [Aminobacter aminovorans]|uniref:hypothetical protein n=1 Tax=Aminobacter TaxID=31988 RepID=UPI00286000B4|nr:hypothetical protein [Aminobacter aminovorans]MDR7224012.1 hypothetical protein [Aminobacter aminovorans]